MKVLFYKIILLLLFITSCSEKQNVKEIEFLSNDKSENQQSQPHNSSVLYVAVSTMISPMETFNLYKDVMDYISGKLEIPIEFKQRKTYREVNDLIAENKLDFAFICNGAFLEARNEIPIEILAVPVVNGKPYYQAYVIVNEESKISEINELKGKSSAFADPLSNTAYSFMINYLK